MSFNVGSCVETETASTNHCRFLARCDLGHSRFGYRPGIPRGVASDQVAVSLGRDGSRMAVDLDCHLKALIDLKVNGNSAFFSAE